jgi:hypothetical protein
VKRITDPKLRGVDCKSTPATLNNIGLYPEELGKMNYIHNNPVKAELVGRAEDYLYSSARDYAGEKGLVEIVMV